MRTAVLIRGHHYYTNPYWIMGGYNSRLSYSPKHFDYRTCFRNIENNFLAPLRNLGELDVYVTTQHSDMEHTLQDIKGIKKVVHPEWPECQLSTIQTGLKEIPSDYDCYAMIRFDVIYKQPIINLWDYKREETTFCLWKEEYHNWHSHSRIPDTIFLVNGRKSWNGFKKSVFEFFDEHAPRSTWDDVKIDASGQQYQTARGLHHLYPLLTKNCPKVDFVVDGYYASNTQLQDPISCNPIYILHDRPYYFKDHPII